MEKKRKKILKVASQLFSEKGYSNTKMEDIAQKDNIGKGTIYIYFKNKEDLLLSIYEYGLNTLSEIKDTFKKMKKGIEIYLSYFEENYSLFKIIFQEKFFEKLNLIKQNFKIAIDRGKLKKINPEELIFLLIEMLHGEIHRWILTGRGYSLKDRAEVIFKIFTEGVRKE